MKWLLLLLLIPFQAHAVFLELDGGYRHIAPDLFNKNTQLDTVNGAWYSVDNNEVFSHFFDVTAHLGTTLIPIPWPGIYWGVYGRWQVPETVQEKGTTGLTGVTVTKKTTLSGAMGGPFVRIAFIEAEKIHVWGEALAGVGYEWFKQSIEGTSTSELTARAFSGEYGIQGGVNWALVGDWLMVHLKGGYMFQHSTAFTSTGTKGSLYSGINDGARIYVRNGADSKELHLDASGWTIGLGVSFSL